MPQRRTLNDWRSREHILHEYRNCLSPRMFAAERPAPPTPVERQLTRMPLDPVASTVKAANKVRKLHISSQSAHATLRILGSAGSPHFVVHAKPPRLGSPKLLIINL